MPGPTRVIEEPLLVGFVGKSQQTRHPAQKPVAVFEQLYRMATCEGDLIVDPMSGSGTTAEAARNLKRLAIISDCSEEYTQIAEQRTNVKHVTALNIDQEPVSTYEPSNVLGKHVMQTQLPIF